MHQAFPKRDLGLPVQLLLRAAYIRLALAGIIGGERVEHKFGPGSRHVDDLLGEFPDGKLARIAEVYGPRDPGWAVHELDKAFDQIIDIAKGACLVAVAIDGDRLVLQGLHNEVRNYPSVIRMHARAVGVENARYLDVELVLAVVVEKQGFGAAFAFIIARAGPIGVHVAPVILGLGMNGRIAIDLRGGSLKNPALQALGKTQHVDGAMYAGLGGLHGIVLIVDGGCRAGEVIDLVHLHIEREGDIMPQKLKAWKAEQMVDIAFCSGEEIIDANNLVAVGKQPVAEMRAQESGSTCDQNGFA